MEDLKKKKLVKTEAEWRKELSDFEYQITREAATEAPFTGEYNHSKQAGTYVCRCCGEPLFSSDTKYDSGSGWPSFFEPIDPEQVETKVPTEATL